MSGGKISDRMSGAMDHGLYATIRAVANHLGVSYRTAQRALREGYIAGDLKREWLGRRLVYTSNQLAMFGVPHGTKKRVKKTPKGLRLGRGVFEENQGNLF